MSLIFMDGFDHYATADITKKWNATGGSPSVNASAGRRSGGALTLTSGTPTISKSITAESSFVIGFAFKTTALPSADHFLCALLDSGTLQCELRFTSTGQLKVTRNGTAVTDGTSTNTIAVDTFYYIEWKVTIADSIAASSCIVKVNGATWLTVATGQDLKNTANTTANSFRFGGSNVAGTYTFDDFYLCNQSGSTNNNFLGDCRIDTLYPTSDGNYSQFTPSTGTTHYTLVDETTPNTSDYNESSTLNHIDSYGMGNLPTSPSTIYGVQVCDAALKDDAGARGLSPFIRSSTTDSVGTELALSTGQLYATAIWETDPATSAAWTASGVNAAEVGGKVTT